MASEQSSCSSEHIGLHLHFGFLEDRLESLLHKHFFLGRTACTIEEDMGERTGPKERSYLRQELVTDAVTHRIGGLEKRVDTIGEHIRTLSAGCHQTPMDLGTSAVCY